LLSPTLHAAHGRVELLEHLAFADDELEALGLAAGEGLAVDLAFEVDGDAVAFGGALAAAAGRRCGAACAGCRWCVSMAASVTSAETRSTCSAPQVAQRDLGVDLEGRVEQRAAPRARRPSARCAGRRPRAARLRRRASLKALPTRSFERPRY
jgi:hypothetical protein